MNEKIKQLAEQAKITFTDYGSGEFLDENDIDTVRLEKFAELIVWECVDIISPYTVRMNKPGESYLHPIQEIKEHFGVE